MIGKVVANRYRILRKIGQGGMGSVYEAEHIAVGQRVAIKCLNPGLSEDENLVRRFMIEARSYGQLAHPHAIQLHDFGQDEEGLLYLSMEYMDGQNLNKVLQEHRCLPLVEATDIILQVCEVLNYAHHKGIIHRDLKPENIMLAKGLRGWHAKVLDFGVARLIDERARVTLTGSICGTPRYMAPEQAQGLEVDLRADIYSVGLVYFECITGVKAISGSSISDILWRQINDPMPTFEQVAPGLVVPKGLDQIIQKAAAKEPEQRFSSMAEFALAVSEVTGAEIAFREHFGQAGCRPVPETIELDTQPVQKGQPRSSKGKRKKWAWIAGLVVTVTLCTVLGLVITKEKKELLPPLPVINSSENKFGKVEVDDNEQPVVAPNVAPNIAIEEIRRVGDASLFNLAQEAFESGRLKNARSTLQKISPTSSFYSEAQALQARVENISNLLQKASRFYQKGQCANAIRIYKQVLASHKGIQTAAKGIARCKREMPVPMIE